MGGRKGGEGEGGESKEGEPRDAQSGLSYIDAHPDASEEDVRIIRRIEETMCSTPDTQWDDIAGLQATKKLLEEATLQPILFPNYFKGG